MSSRESSALPVSLEPLSSLDRATLFELARDALAEHLLGTPRPAVNASPRLLANGAVFVTLRSHDGALRGCIGTTRFERPLVEIVPELAVAAASEDRRFESVAAAELDTLAIHLSVLTPLTRANVDAIVIGRHGLVVRRGGNSGLLLPQVASERGWDATTFLQETSRKAGLPLDAWKAPDATVLWFTTESF